MDFTTWLHQERSCIWYVQIAQLSPQRTSILMNAGDIRFAGLGRCEGKYICGSARQDPLRNLPRRMECHVEGFRKRNHSYGTIPRYCCAIHIAIFPLTTGILYVIIPGLALAPWDVMGGGRFRTDEEDEQRRQLDDGQRGRYFAATDGKLNLVGWERTPTERAVSLALEKVAREVGAPNNMRAVAIAYVLRKTTHVFPVLGARKPEQVLANIEALSIELSDEQVQFLESAVEFEVGFPHTLIVSCSFGLSDSAG